MANSREQISCLGGIPLIIPALLMVLVGCCGQDIIDNKCQGEYSWTVTRPGQEERTYSYSLKKQLRTDCTRCDTVVPGVYVDIGEGAPKPTLHEISFYGAKNDHNESITCFSVSFSISRYIAEKYEGFYVSVQNYPHYEACFFMNFTTKLEYDAVYDKTVLPDKNKIFHFDCICGVKPLEDFRFIMRPVPFSVNNCRVEDDQLIQEIITVPDCRDPIRKWPDKYCPVSEVTPKPIEIQQVYPNVNTVRVSFTIQPPSSITSQYRVILCDSNDYCDDETILFNELDAKRDGDTNIMLFTKEYNGTTLHRASVDFVCKDLEQSVTAHIILGAQFWFVSGPFDLQENPCDGKRMCNNSGVCIPIPEGYYCQCDDGAINVNNHTCADDPCDPNPCDYPETCRVTHSERMAFNHSCVCPDNISCKPTPETGHSRGAANPEKDVNESSGNLQIVAGISAGLVVVVAAVLAVVVVRFCRPCRPPNDDTPSVFTIPNHGGVDIVFEETSGKSEVLFAFPDNDKEFVSIVEKLALFVKKYLDIIPILHSQRTVDIGRKGQEVWLTDMLNRSSKILWICSDSVGEWWQDSHSNCAYGNMFKTLIRLTKDEREKMGERGKHVVCFFSKVSSFDDVPKIFCDLPRFKLNEQMEDMCFYILGEERSTIEYASHMPYISGKKGSIERTALEEALDRWEERRTHPSSRLLPNGTVFSNGDITTGTEFSNADQPNGTVFGKVDNATDITNFVILAAIANDETGGDAEQIESNGDSDFVTNETAPDNRIDCKVQMSDSYVDFVTNEIAPKDRVDCVVPIRTTKGNNSLSLDNGYSSMLSDQVS